MELALGTYNQATAMGMVVSNFIANQQTSLLFLSKTQSSQIAGDMQCMLSKSKSVL
jgi:hypothetical protein